MTLSCFFFPVWTSENHLSVINRDRDGSLSKSEIVQSMQQLGIEVDPDEVRALFDKVDQGRRNIYTTRICKFQIISSLSVFVMLLVTCRERSDGV